MQGLANIVTVLDTDVLNRTLPILTNIVRRTLGLPTKAGCARFIGMLVTASKSSHILTELHADALLQALSGTVQDENANARDAYAEAISVILPLASEAKTKSFFNFVTRIYVNSEEVLQAKNIGKLLKIISSGDEYALEGSKAQLVPILMMGMHDATQEVSQLFHTAWESLSGTPSTVRLYFDEIMQMMEQMIESPRWTQRRMAAMTLASICSTQADEIARRSAHIDCLLKKSLDGRTWDGKQYVLEASLAFVIACNRSHVCNDEMFEEYHEVYYCSSALLKFIVAQA